MNRGDKEHPRYEQEEWPDKCGTCIVDRQAYGCGFDERYEGKGTAELLSGDPLQTCPQYLSSTPFVASVLRYLPDYKDGRLGDVRDLPGPLLDCLRAAAIELSEWQKRQEDRIRDGC